MGCLHSCCEPCKKRCDERWPLMPWSETTRSYESLRGDSNPPLPVPPALSQSLPVPCRRSGTDSSSEPNSLAEKLPISPGGPLAPTEIPNCHPGAYEGQFARSPTRVRPCNSKGPRQPPRRTRLFRRKLTVSTRKFASQKPSLRTIMEESTEIDKASTEERQVGDARQTTVHQEADLQAVPSPLETTVAL